MLNKVVLHRIFLYRGGQKSHVRCVRRKRLNNFILVTITIIPRFYILIMNNNNNNKGSEPSVYCTCLDSSSIIWSAKQQKIWPFDILDFHKVSSSSIVTTRHTIVMYTIIRLGSMIFQNLKCKINYNSVYRLPQQNLSRS